MDKVIGRITPTNQSIRGKLTPTGLSVRGTVAPSVYSRAEQYLGDYDITPQAESQTFNTKNRRMNDDITIEAIPYYETSNEYGITVTIGG